MRRLAGAAAGLLLASALQASSPAGAPQPRAAVGRIESGDLVFRRGVGVEAAAVLAAQARSGTDYSHVGVALRVGERVWIAHATPAESAGETDAAKLEPLEVYLAPSRASHAAVYRLRDTSARAAVQARSAAAQAAAMAERAVPFDRDFDLSSDRAVYCTELAWRAYAQAGVDLQVQQSAFELLGARRTVLLPADLMRSPLLRRVD